jgi:hypothetical protein
LLLVGTIVCHHTSVGVLPRAAFSAPTSSGAMYGMRSIASKLKTYFSGSIAYHRIVSCFAGQRLFGRPP